jgi:hypothetical protein
VKRPVNRPVIDGIVQYDVAKAFSKTAPCSARVFKNGVVSRS